MYNPLLPEVSKLKDTELENKIVELSKKYFIAANMGHGNICQQISSALELYKEELNRRQNEAMQKVLKKQDKNLDDLINVD